MWLVEVVEVEAVEVVEEDEEDEEDEEEEAAGVGAEAKVAQHIIKMLLVIFA